MKLLRILCCLFWTIGIVSPASGIDHGNLDEGRPLHLEDAYPVSEGEWVIEAGAGFSFRRNASDQLFFPIQLIYGAMPNFHFEVGTAFFTDPHEVDDPRKSGDVSMAALYNFNQETLSLPAIGIKGAVILPSGVDSSGIDLEITGLLTKSFNRLSMHLNASYMVNNSNRNEERDGRYRFVFGPSYPIGAPLHTRTTLAGDIFIEQSAERGEDETVGAEGGIRYQYTERIVIDAALGSEMSGPGDRARFFMKGGFSFVF